MKFLIQVEAIGALKGCLTIEADSNEEAMEKAKTADKDLITWKRPEIQGNVFVRRSMPLEGDIHTFKYVELHDGVVKDVTIQPLKHTVAPPKHGADLDVRQATPGRGGINFEKPSKRRKKG